MKKFALAFIMMLVLALTIAPSVSAQEDGCFNLSAEDCAIINAATANSNNITSFNQNFSIDFTASGLETLAMFSPGVPPEVSFNVVGSGPFSLLPDAEIPLATSLNMVVNADFGEGAQIDGFVVPFAIVDNYVYFPTGSELVGVPISAEDLGELAASSGLGFDPTTMMGEDMTGMMEGMGGLAEAFAGFESFVDYQRLPDADVAGQTVYPFQFSIDLGGILNSPEFVEAMNMVGGMAAGMLGEEAGAEEMAGMMSMLTPLLQGIDSTIVVTQGVGADDNFIHSLTLDWDLSADLSALMGGEPGSMAPIVANFLFNVELTDINSNPSISAPEGARLLTEEEAAALLGEGM